jgi:predicted dehydrogenase
MKRLKIGLDGNGIQGGRVLGVLLPEAKRLLDSQEVEDVSWVVVEPDADARGRAAEMLRQHGISGRCFAELEPTLAALAEQPDARCMFFVAAPTELHYEITAQAAPVANVLVIEKPACVTPDEYAGWCQLHQHAAQQGRKLLTNLTEVASSAVRGLRCWRTSQTEFSVDSAIYFRGSNVGQSWDWRRGVMAHSFEDKSVHDAAAHIAVTRPDDIRVEPDVSVHRWLGKWAASASVDATFTKDGESVPVLFESSVDGIPDDWVHRAESLELGRDFVSRSTTTIQGREFVSEDMRLGVLNLEPRRTGRVEQVVINFLGKGDLRPWVCVSDRVGWHDIPLPDAEGGLRRIVSGALAMALGGTCEDTFLDFAGEAMVIRFTIDATASVEHRYGRREAEQPQEMAKVA